MVSDMREWCNQSKPCGKCGGLGVIEVMDPTHSPDEIFDWETGRSYVLCSCNKQPDITPKPRMSWDDIWMDLAKSVGSRSTCKIPNRQIGCVIISDDNTSVLSIGYNGSAKGDDNSCEYTNDTKKMGDSRCTCVHAEQNALVKLNTTNPCKKKMYLTLSPCSLCYKLIVNAGINEVIYDTEYSFIQLQKLIDLGIKVRQYEDNRNRR